jgi:hypothetical protein
MQTDASPYAGTGAWTLIPVNMTWVTTEITAEKPIARWAAHSITPATVAPDCEMTATSP